MSCEGSRHVNRSQTIKCIKIYSEEVKGMNRLSSPTAYSLKKRHDEKNVYLWGRYVDQMRWCG